MTRAEEKEYEEFEVNLDANTYEALSIMAQERGISVDELASEIVTAELRKEIEAAQQDDKNDA